MSRAKHPSEIADDALDETNGGGVFQTPAGGWGRQKSILFFDEADSVRKPNGNKVVFEPNDET